MTQSIMMNVMISCEFCYFLTQLKFFVVVVFLMINFRTLILQFTMTSALIFKISCDFRKIGFYGIFTTAAILYLFAIFYGVIYVVEKEVHDDKRKIMKNYKNFISDFFDREHVIETIKVAFKTGENQRRLRVIMLLIVVMVVIGPLHGEMSVMYLFTRYKFNWSEIE